MKFHGITMVGPFVNQKLAAVPTFDPDRDQGRLVWISDGTLWYGSDTEWVNFSAGAGDANEVEDMYSDLLRTTIFLNGSYDEFAIVEDDNPLVSDTTMTHSAKLKTYTYSAGQYIESGNLYDATTDMEWVDYVLPSVDYVGDGNSTIQVSSDGGSTWFAADNNQIFRIPNDSAGTDLRMRFTAGGSGTLLSWGIMYNKDLSAACTKYGLTYANFEANEGQTFFELDYVPGAIQIFLNGDLLDTSDYFANSGSDVIFMEPLHEGDIVYILSFSTSVLNPNVDFNDYIRHDGTVVFTNDQSMGDNKLTNVSEGVDPYDAVNKLQLDGVIGNIDLSPYTKVDGSRPFTGDQSMGGNGLVNVGDPVDDTSVMSRGYADGRYIQSHKSSIERLPELVLIDIPSTGIVLPHNLPSPYDNTFTYDLTLGVEFSGRRPLPDVVGSMVRVYIEADSTADPSTEFDFYCYVQGEVVARCGSNVINQRNSVSVDVFVLPSSTSLSVRLFIDGSANSGVDCAAKVSHIGWYY